jgi:DNA-binding transcriptional LysR family regulator
MNPSAVKWDDLRVFLEVARQGSVHSASKRLKLDHSTVCRRISKLETTLSMKLLDRTQRGILLREEARDLVRHIEKMEVHANSLEDVVTSDHSRDVQTVRIATMEGIASRYIARRLPLLERTTPNLKLELVSIPQSVDLSRKEADIFLSFFNPPTAGLTNYLIAKFSLYLFCSGKYSAKYGMPRSLKELADHRFISYIDEMVVINAVRWLDDVVTNPNVVFHSNSIIAQCSAAVDGLGIVMLPTFCGSDVPGLVRVLPDETRVEREVWMSVRVEQSHLKRIRAVMQFLTQAFKHDRAFLMGETDRLGEL